MVLPTVTQVLKLLSDFSGIDAGVLDHASRRGSAVHQACAAWAQDLWVPALPAAWQPFFDSFLGWTPYIDKVLAVEFEIEEKTFGYRGHPDMVVLIRGDREPTLLDIKTPATISRLWRLQTAAYRKGAHKMGIGRHGVLQLRPDGKPARMLEYTETYQNDLSLFLAALGLYRFMEG